MLPCCFARGSGFVMFPSSDRPGAPPSLPARLCWMQLRIFFLFCGFCTVRSARSLLLLQRYGGSLENDKKLARREVDGLV